MALSTESGLITKPSNYSVHETIERFEAAIKAKGWVVFTELDHAAAAAQAGLALRPRMKSGWIRMLFIKADDNGWTFWFGDCQVMIHPSPFRQANCLPV